MRIVVVYVYAPNAGGLHEVSYPTRFLQTYTENPAGVEHECVVVSATPNIDPGMRVLWENLLHNCTVIFHDNSGWDIGAFQFAARTIPCDLMVFFGSSSYFYRAGWLQRMVGAFGKHGDTVYGAMVNAGDIPVGVWPHIRTTGFWMSPHLMNQYPLRITEVSQRHTFEHKQNSLTEWVRSTGRTPWVVTWHSELPYGEWAYPHSGFQQGDQYGLLCRDRYCDPPFYPTK